MCVFFKNLFMCLHSRQPIFNTLQSVSIAIDAVKSHFPPWCSKVLYNYLGLNRVFRVESADLDNAHLMLPACLQFSFLASPSCPVAAEVKPTGRTSERVSGPLR